MADGCYWHAGSGYPIEAEVMCTLAVDYKFAIAISFRLCDSLELLGSTCTRPKQGHARSDDGCAAAKHPTSNVGGKRLTSQEQPGYSKPAQKLSNSRSRFQLSFLALATVKAKQMAVRFECYRFARTGNGHDTLCSSGEPAQPGRIGNWQQSPTSDRYPTIPSKFDCTLSGNCHLRQGRERLVNVT